MITMGYPLTPEATAALVADSRGADPPANPTRLVVGLVGIAAAVAIGAWLLGRVR